MHRIRIGMPIEMYNKLMKLSQKTGLTIGHLVRSAIAKLLKEFEEIV